jgi:SAM-dependent methyltransferase
MAAGYAKARPPVHAHVVDLVRQRLGTRLNANRVLDVGCGAGLSTKPLQPFAGLCLGVEPSAAMLRCAREIAPGAHFVAGAAEALPIQTHSIDLIAAAGSLNYVKLARFFPEASRVLAPGGILLVYDFSAGRSFRSTEDLDHWFGHFRARYPVPAAEAVKLSPEILERIGTGFRLSDHAYFETGIRMRAECYAAYMMTETNVAKAIRDGIPHREILEWLRETLEPVFEGPEREVVFRGYYACMEPSVVQSLRHFQ